jgi:hypothetical protein
MQRGWDRQTGHTVGGSAAALGVLRDSAPPESCRPRAIRLADNTLGQRSNPDGEEQPVQGARITGQYTCVFVAFFSIVFIVAPRACICNLFSTGCQQKRA